MNYKSKLDDFLSGDPTNKNKSKGDDAIQYFDANYIGVRNVCFVLLDGKQLFLNYNYLVSGEFTPEGSTITLRFTTLTVTLSGYYLEKLFQDFMQHTPKMISVMDERYSGIAHQNSPNVTNILYSE